MKASHFGDTAAEKAIMESTNPSQMKYLGENAIKGFKEIEWAGLAEQTMLKGCRLKFAQNPDLKHYLLQTNAKIAEANPNDSQFGIGLSLSDPKALDPNKWKGSNWMGDILQEIKEELK